MRGDERSCYISTEDRACEPFTDMNQTICEWKQSKYNIGRRRGLIKALETETAEPRGDGRHEADRVVWIDPL